MPSFTGRVVNLRNEPIHRATVSIEFQGIPSVVFTDSQGFFTVTTNAISGSIFYGRIRVEAEGYESYERLIELHTNNTNQDIELKEKQKKGGQETREPPIVGIIISIITTAGLVIIALINKPSTTHNPSSSTSLEPTTTIQTLTPITASISPSPVPVEGIKEHNYRTVFTTDGITTVRKTPSLKGGENEGPKLKNPGTIVRCETKTRIGETVELKQGVSNKWKYCPDVGGYISDVLLSPVEE
jgi:hypothetical protein